ncbi:MAG: hypothetical protein AB7M12_00540 [Hyphomonadaceae bacterium]
MLREIDGRDHTNDANADAERDGRERKIVLRLLERLGSRETREADYAEIFPSIDAARRVLPVRDVIHPRLPFSRFARERLQDRLPRRPR